MLKDPSMMMIRQSRKSMTGLNQSRLIKHQFEIGTTGEALKSPTIVRPSMCLLTSVQLAYWMYVGACAARHTFCCWATDFIITATTQSACLPCHQSLDHDYSYAKAQCLFQRQRRWQFPCEWQAGEQYTPQHPAPCNQHLSFKREQSPLCQTFNLGCLICGFSKCRSNALIQIAHGMLPMSFLHDQSYRVQLGAAVCSQLLQSEGHLNNSTWQFQSNGS